VRVVSGLSVFLKMDHLSRLGDHNRYQACRFMGKPEPLYKRRPRLVGAIGGALGLTLVVILAVGIL